MTTLTLSDSEVEQLVLLVEGVGAGVVTKPHPQRPPGPRHVVIGHSREYAFELLRCEVCVVLDGVLRPDWAFLEELKTNYSKGCFGCQVAIYLPL